MTTVTTGFALAALGLPENFEHYLNLVKALEIPAFIIFSGKTALAWPLCYHSFNGIRHLAWDLGFGFDMNILYKTGWFVFIGSMGAAAALAYFLLAWLLLELLWAQQQAWLLAGKSALASWHVDPMQ